jgi:hypothetical protein
MRSIPAQSLIVGSIGALLVAISLCIPMFKDQEYFMTESSRLSEEVRARGSGQSKGAISAKYWALRDSQLTHRFVVQDYGLCLVALASVLGVISVSTGRRTWTDLKRANVPKTRWPIVALWATAALSVPVAYVADLMQEFGRMAFPSWADSLGIPLMGVPVIAAASALCASVFLLVLLRGYAGGAPIESAFSREFRPAIGWILLLGIPLLLSTGIAVISLFSGHPIAFISSAIWSMSLLVSYAARQKRI